VESRSTIATVQPASKEAAAMPAPIVPPPITPTRSIARGLALRISGTFGTAFSARKM
jgi:hypothetical protein